MVPFLYIAVLPLCSCVAIYVCPVFTICVARLDVCLMYFIACKYSFNLVRYSYLFRPPYEKEHSKTLHSALLFPNLLLYFLFYVLKPSVIIICSEDYFYCNAF